MPFLCCGSQLVGLPPGCRGALFSPHVETHSPAMAIQRSSTSKSLVKVVVAAALGMLLSKSGSLPPVLLGPSTVRVYHYTNKAGHHGIVESVYIEPSDIKQGDASYGSGVYATQLDPSTPPYTVLHNNYDMDGGINGRGEDKMDRADYVFALDLPKSSVKFVDTNASRSVLCVGGGEAVPLGETTYHGPADVVAEELKRELEFQEFLSQDSILATAWQHYAISNDVKLVFVYMDNLNYRKKLLARKNGNCNQDVPAVVSKTCPPNQLGVRGFDKVLVMLTSHGKVPGCSGDWEQCIFHGDIDRVESDLVCKLEQWTKLWVDLEAYPRQLDFLTKLRREVLARDCQGSRYTCLICVFAASPDKSKPIERRRNSWFWTTSQVSVSLHELRKDGFHKLRKESWKQRAKGKEKAYVFIAPLRSNWQKVEWEQCLLYGDIEQVVSTLSSWNIENSRVTGLTYVHFWVWKKSYFQRVLESFGLVFCLGVVVAVSARIYMLRPGY